MLQGSLKAATQVPGDSAAVTVDSVSVTERDALVALRGDDPVLAARAEAALWAMWTRSTDDEVNLLMRDGVAAMAARRFADAEQHFTRIIERVPGFAEGWNKRATVRYLAEDFPGAIADCQATLARNPDHFGALSGQGLCHLARGEAREAAALFRRALAVHPHLEAVRENLRVALANAVQGNGH
jgi:Flp pilus assembly protein TadD